MTENSAIMMEDNDMTIPFGEEHEPKKLTKKPIAVIFHIIFKVLSILAYMIFGSFTSGFIVTFVVIVSFLSIDFWTTKNITGRLLVGLRWWNYVDENGKSHWIFESRKIKPAALNVSQTSNIDSTIFWSSLLIAQVFWSLFVFAAFLTFKFQWMLVAVLGFCLNGANVYGYIRCKLGSKENPSSLLSKQVFNSMIAKFSFNSQPSSQTAAFTL